MSRYHSPHAYDERDPRNEDDGSPRTEGPPVDWDLALKRFDEAKAILDAELRASMRTAFLAICPLCDGTGQLRIKTVPHDAFIRCPCLPAPVSADAPDGTMSEILNQTRRTT